MSEKRIVIAIDGPAGAGKSTLARRVADKLGFVYINSGAMYRAIALWALRLKVETSDMHRLEQLAKEAERDHRDRQRTEAPLVQAPDAELVDTTGLSLEEVEEIVLKLVRARTSNGTGAHSSY